MDRGLTVPKWVLIVWPKIPQMLQNLSAQAQKFGISMKKGFLAGRPYSVVKTIHFMVKHFYLKKVPVNLMVKIRYVLG